MGKIKGEKEYKKWQDKKKLTRKQAMLANCFMCNGLNESREDCQGENCPIYQYAPYRGKGKLKGAVL